MKQAISPRSRQGSRAKPITPLPEVTTEEEKGEPTPHWYDVKKQLVPFLSRAEQGDLSGIALSMPERAVIWANRLILQSGAEAEGGLSEEELAYLVAPLNGQMGDVSQAFGGEELLEVSALTRFLLAAFEGHDLNECEEVMRLLQQQAKELGEREVDEPEVPEVEAASVAPVGQASVDADLANGTAVTTGWLYKKHGKGDDSFFTRRNWDKRWFQLKGPYLSYFEEEGNRGQPRWVGDLRKARRDASGTSLNLQEEVIKAGENGRFMLTLTFPDREVRVGTKPQAPGRGNPREPGRSEMQDWVEQMQRHFRFSLVSRAAGSRRLAVPGAKPRRGSPPRRTGN